MTAAETFRALYRKIAVRANYLEPAYPRMEGWAIDCYESGMRFAAMADSGYTTWVGEYDETKSRSAWRVIDACGKPLQFEGITEEEFLAVDI